MRQVGYISAAALYAVENNIERLKDDHDKAKSFASVLGSIKGFSIDKTQVQTNMVFADIAGTGKSQLQVIEMLQARGVLVTPERHSSIRAVMHLGVTKAEVETAAGICTELFS